MVALLAFVTVASGCAHWATLGTPITAIAPERGYRLATAVAPHTGDDLLVVAAFSGGGMRAAALAHGVLRQLAASRYGDPAAPRALLDELDVISGVSGGAVTAAYFALDRRRYFEQFEARFLQRNVSRDMWLALLNPVTLVRLMSRRYARGDLYAEMLDRRLFDGATFADLTAADGAPFVILNATDLSVGGRFDFTQDRFDSICADLARYPLARAVAASAATPPVVSPLVLRNYAGQCGYRLPDWVATAGVTPVDAGGVAARRSLIARDLLAYQQVSRYPYLHLADGSIADDLGLRALTDTMLGAASDPAPDMAAAGARKIVLIAVNAAADGGPAIARRRAAPRELATAQRAAQVTLDRYSIESTLLLRTQLEELGRRPGGPRPEIYLIEVDPRRLSDPAARDAIMSAPTRLALTSPLAGQIVQAGSQLLAESPEFRRLLADLHAAGP